MDHRVGRVLSIFFAIILIGIAVSTCGTIESGNVGLRTTLGKVSPDEIEPGLYLRLPGISSVYEFSGKEIAVDLNDLTPKAKDNLSLRDLDVTVYYKVKPSAITELYVKYSAQHVRDEQSHVYLPAHAMLQRLARNIIYEETSRFDSLVMHTKRDELAICTAWLV